MTRKYTVAENFVCEALQDLRKTYGGGWALIALTAQHALILQRVITYLRVQETPRSGQIATSLLNEVCLVIDLLPADADRVIPGAAANQEVG